jgi:hypothetical protein
VDKTVLATLLDDNAPISRCWMLTNLNQLVRWQTLLLKLLAKQIYKLWLDLLSLRVNIDLAKTAVVPEYLHQLFL